MPLYGQNANFKHFTDSDGMPQSQVQALFRDREGFLWAGSFSGLGRYDGARWKIFGRENGLNRNYITALSQTNDGQLIVGIRQGGLKVLQGDQFRLFSENAFLSSCNVQALLCEANGRVWVAANEGLALIDGPNVRIFAEEDGLPSSQCLALYQRANGALCVATKKGVALFRGNRFQELGKQDDWQGATPKGLAEDQLGRLFLATKRGLYLLEKDRFKEFRPNELGNIAFTVVTPDRKGKLWFGTEHNGVVGLEGERLQWLNLETGLLHESISSILADTEDLLWIGTDLCLSRYAPGPFRSYTQKHGLPDAFVRALFSDKEGTLWVGTRNGLAKKRGEQNFQIVDSSGFSTPRFYGMAQGLDETLYFATSDGFSLMREGKFTHFNRLNGFPADEVRTTFVDHRGWIWIGAEGLIRFDGKRFLTLASNNPLSRTVVMQMVEDNKGWLWMATVSGIVAFQPETGEMRTFEDYRDQIVWSITTDGKGQIWAATNGSGILHWDGSKIQVIGLQQGLGNMTVWQVLCARNGDLWVGHSSGLDRFSSKGVEHFNRYDGMADNEGSATAILEDGLGRIWSGCGYGLNCFDPTSEMAQLAPLNPQLTGIWLRDKPIQWSATEPFERNANSFRFEFSAMRLFKEEEVKYQYRLLGLDENWQQTKEAAAMYRNLGPGSYRFEVKANFGQEHSPKIAFFKFRVLPAFWESSLFWALVILFLATCIHMLLRYKTRKAERDRVSFEQRIEQKTSALKEANKNLLETQHRLVEAAHRAGMAEIATGILHNVGNVLNSVNVSLDVIEKTTARGDGTALLQRIGEMISQNQENLAEYLSESNQGRKLPETLQRITEILVAHRDKVTREVLQLRTKIFHINEIVRTQQNYAKLDGYRERIDVNQLLEDALKIQANLIEKHEVKVKCEYVNLPLIVAPKIQLMQIFINLIKNAIEASESVLPPEKRCLEVETDLVSIHELDAQNQPMERQIVKVHIGDNGMGIDPERLKKLFVFGYTSKKGGHGFGLHYCATAIEEMGGKIRAESEGAGKGAAFILELPVEERH